MPNINVKSARGRLGWCASGTPMAIETPSAAERQELSGANDLANTVRFAAANS